MARKLSNTGVFGPPVGLEIETVFSGLFIKFWEILFFLVAHSVLIRTDHVPGERSHRQKEEAGPTFDSANPSNNNESIH